MSSRPATKKIHHQAHFVLRLSLLSSALGLAYGSANAQSTPAEKTLSEISVTANPLGNTLFDLTSPVTSLSGRNLTIKQESSLGETLNGEAGVSSTYFGPNASRPIIRGLDGDRIRLMQNGAGLVDASSLSFDHAAPLEPLLTEKIEVVRGAAALMYGGNAVGGVVNTIDNRIPKQAIDGQTGSVEARYGGAETERAGAAVIETGDGQWALHADVTKRQTSDLKIPGFAHSARQRQLDDPTLEQARDRLPNSAANTDGGAVGISRTWNTGYVGASYSGYNSTYGTVAEPDVNIRMRSDRFDMAGENRQMEGFVQSVKFNFNANDYEHKEFDVPTGDIGTTFKNKGFEARVEATHQAITTRFGQVKGAFGLQVSQIKFSALGDEAFVPQTKTDAMALFAFEELVHGNWRFNLGARIEHNKVRSDGGGPTDPNTGTLRFDPAQTKHFTPTSFALGTIYQYAPGYALAANLSHTDRAPTFYELFANGPHAATGRYELGDTNMQMEQSNSLDLAWRIKQGAHSGSVGVFYTRFNNFVGLFDTTNTRDGDGLLNSGATDALPEQIYRQVRAVFKGIEAEGRFQVWQQGPGKLELLLRGDITRATNQDNGEPIPRIAPARLMTGLAYSQGAWNGGLQVTHAYAQNRIPTGDFPTMGYTQVNADISYRLPIGQTDWLLFAKLYNLTNADIRSASSILRDISPYGERSVKVGVRVVF
ncbi:TonB-dependent receptor [Ampullimonas aquatilis]|uniref:TonB-dependent receptor n=1 Tax=Ampullimonas aquatilis TaxID=1341549 RepID=UPI003C796DE0